MAGKAGLFLAGGNPSVSAVWPPSGIAIAALLLGDSELWPAIFVGAFFVNVTTTGDFVSSLGIASGNTFEALAGAFLARRFATGKFAFSQPKTVLTFALLSGLVATTSAATIGSLTLTLTHHSAPSAFLGVWIPWWLGDAIGVIEVTPLLLAVAFRLSSPRDLKRRRTRGEAYGLAAITLAVSVLVFAREPSMPLGGYPLVFLVVPPSIWAAFRYGTLGATLSVSTVSVVAVLATVAGNGPFATLPPSLSLLALRIFIGSLSLTAVLVAADVTQHQHLESELDHTRKELQRMLKERTVELDAAKSIARVGIWTFDARSEKVVWSEEMYQILGYGSARFPVDLHHALDRMTAPDRDQFLWELRTALAEPEALDHVVTLRRYRVHVPGSEPRTILSQLRVTGVENGAVTRITGTVQDVTERQRIEDELRRLQGEEAPDAREDTPFLMWMVPWVGRIESGAPPPNATETSPSPPP